MWAGAFGHPVRRLAVLKEQEHLAAHLQDKGDEVGAIDPREKKETKIRKSTYIIIRVAKVAVAIAVPMLVLLLSIALYSWNNNSKDSKGAHKS